MVQPVDDQREWRRRLLLVPIRDYPDADDDYREGIDEQLSVAATWWGSKHTLGDDCFEAVSPAVLTTRRDLENFVHDSGLRDATAGEVLVVYVTGHGYKGPSGSHVLVMPGGADDRIVRHGYPTEDLVGAALHSDAEHVLVIVNACFANAVAADLVRQLRDLPPHRRTSRTLAVICSADFDQRPQVREFSTLLARAHEQLRRTAGIAGAQLSVDEFLLELARAARSDPWAPLLEPFKAWPQRVCDSPTPCLPNPGYQRPDAVVEPARAQVAAGATELDFWMDRASGRQDAADGGWYFSGRHDLTTQVAQFLTGDAGMLVVTGTAGTGKSAIIARAVTLSDPSFQDDPRYAAAVRAAPPGTAPPVRCVDVAVQARNKEVTELLEQILIGLGTAPVPTAAGADRAKAMRDQAEQVLAQRTHPGGRAPVVVLDGLDEAKLPVRVITDLVGPLARATRPDGGRLVRWLIGVRSPRPDTGTTIEDGLLDLVLRGTRGRETQIVRTDGPGVRDDIAGYVAAVLNGGPGRYGADSPARVEVSRVIAERVSPSFLDARLAAGRLLDNAHPPALDDPGWLASLDDGTIGQLRLDLLDEASAALVDETVALLRAAAFALGAGVPWADVWPAMAGAVLGRPLTDADSAIERLLSGRLSGYLQRSVEDGRVVYSPAHERLGQILRDQAATVIGDPG